MFDWIKKLLGWGEEAIEDVTELVRSVKGVFLEAIEKGEVAIQTIRAKIDEYQRAIDEVQTEANEEIDKLQKKIDEIQEEANKTIDEFQAKIDECNEALEDLESFLEKLKKIVGEP